jgi:adenine-specific DNA-methyltransferase
MAKKPSTSTHITSHKHTDTRANIPTEELRDLVADEERSPKTILYPRDPSLDPQIVWKGKDEQDREDLAVPAVPIYIQEKVSPQAIIENVRAQAKKDQTLSQMALFADFNSMAFEDQIDFYHHEQNWTNRIILGDSLLVMTSLAEKEGLKGQVQMIYMDPPYGIKFGSNWQVSTRKRDVKDGKAEDATRQPEQIKAFRDTWQLGIHSYLAYLRDRLVVARELLTESGSVFVQIGDENDHLVRCVMDEVFGSENFVGQISFAKTTGFSGNYLSLVLDHILWYGKNFDSVKFNNLFKEKEIGEEGASKYRQVNTISSMRNSSFESTRPATSDQLTSQGESINLSEQMFYFRTKNWLPPSGLHWKTTVAGMQRLSEAGRIITEGNSLRYIRFLDDFPVFPYTNIWLDIGGVQSRTDPKVYVVQTATEAVKRCLLMTTDPGDLVLDPTCGSGTTAYVAEQWGRRWITVDTSRVSVALARTRLMAGRFPYYLLADSPEGVRKEAELAGQLPSLPLPATNNDVKKGFIYRKVPHITLKSIANNEEIDTIYTRFQEHLEPLLAQINQKAGKNWKEWEVPREGSSDLKGLLTEWWNLRRERQKEIDASITRRADTEQLYDQPYEDNKRIRVTGPFTVESLSPHRVLSTDEERPESEVTGQQTPARASLWR